MNEPESTDRPAPIPSATGGDRVRLTSGHAFLAGAGVLLGFLYLLNPTLGVFELIPDNMPLIGNLDEAAATTLMVLGLQQIGRFWSARPKS